LPGTKDFHDMDTHTHRVNDILKLSWNGRFYNLGLLPNLRSHIKQKEPVNETEPDWPMGQRRNQQCVALLKAQVIK
jgi:hypothetical protein